MYRVMYTVYETPQTAEFEFESRAVSFAEQLEGVDDIDEVTVIDEFHEQGQYTEIYPNDERVN